MIFTKNKLAATLAALMVSGGAWAQAAANPEMGAQPQNPVPSTMEPANIEPSPVPAAPAAEPMAPLPTPLPVSGSDWKATDLYALPEEQTYGNVRFISGGVNYEQLPAIKEARDDYPLGIEIYQKNGAKSEFTADADVKVFDKAGNLVLETKADGPFVLAKVPPGTYRVEASLNGETRKTKMLNVGRDKHTRAMIIFPEGTD